MAAGVSISPTMGSSADNAVVIPIFGNTRLIDVLQALNLLVHPSSITFADKWAQNLSLCSLIQKYQYLKWFVIKP